MSAVEAISWLFVPGSRSDRFDKAAAAGAGAVILDWEDAVAPEEKAAARQASLDWLGSGSAWVRVNGVGTAAHEADLDALNGGPAGLCGVVLPKAEPEAVAVVHGTLGAGVPLVALVESARGVVEIERMAGSGLVDRIAFGSVDYALDAGSDESDESLAYARARIVTASRAFGLPAPVDGITAEVTDLDRAGRDAGRARRSGFGGKLCVHPAQVPVVEAAFLPTDAEVEWASEVVARLAEDPSGVLVVGGLMVDVPVAARARRILAARGSR